MMGGGSGGGGGGGGAGGGGKYPGREREKPPEPVGKGVEAHNLLEADKAILDHYTHEFAAMNQPDLARDSTLLTQRPKDVNKMLWDDKTPLTPEGKRYVDRLTGVLDQIKPYKGDLKRNITFDTASKLQDSYQVGKVVTMKPFSSATKMSNTRYNAPTPKEVASLKKHDLHHFDNKSFMQFEIKSKTARPMGKAVTQTDKQEHIFKPGTKFNVTGKTYDSGKGLWKVNLEEI